MKHKVLKLAFISILFLVVGFILVPFLINLLFLGVFNTLFDSEVKGVYATNVLMRFCLCAIPTICICLFNTRDDEARRVYLSTIEGEQYQAKKDIGFILRDRMYWAECAIFSILSIVMMIIVEKPVWIFVACIPLFAIVNCCCFLYEHKTWASNRIRIARSENSD